MILFLILIPGGMDVSRQSRGIKFSIGNATQEKGSTPAAEKRKNLRLISNSNTLRSSARALENDKKYRGSEQGRILRYCRGMEKEEK